jgi:hypothetical protein
VRAQAVDWERVLRQASGHLVLPALAAALRDLDLSRSVDEELRAFLDAVHGANVERNRELRGELTAVIGVLNRLGVEPVLLKGAIRLVDGLYPDEGWRMLRDLDLLVPEAGWAAAVQALQRAGYTLAREAATAAVLRRPGGPVTIDVHAEPFCTPRRQGLLSGEEVLNSARPAVIGNAVVRLPSLVHQMIHLIGHGQISNYNQLYGRIGLRDRLEAAALTHWAAEPVDWQAVATRFATAGYRRAVPAFALALRDGALCAVPPPRKVDFLTALQARRIAWQARSRILAHIGFWPMWCVAMLRIQLEERERGRPKLVQTLRKLIFERGAGQRMLRTLIYDAPRPWMLMFLSSW